MEVVDSDGVIHEAETLAEAASELIERPPYRKRAGYTEDGEWGREYNVAFLEAQKKIGPTIGLDQENSFNGSRYSSLPALLSKVQPTLNDCGFIVNFSTGTVKLRGDGKQQFFLPVFLTLTHAETGQWRIVGHEIPVLKFDPQSFGGLITYGCRYVLRAHMSIAGTDQDDDGVQASHEVTAEDKQKMLSSMLKKIEACQSPLDLRAWYKRNEQQIASLGEQEANVLREAWQKKLDAVKPAAKKSEKANA